MLPTGPRRGQANLPSGTGETPIDDRHKGDHRVLVKIEDSTLGGSGKLARFGTGKFKVDQFGSSASFFLEERSHNGLAGKHTQAAWLATSKPPSL